MKFDGVAFLEELFRKLPQNGAGGDAPGKLAVGNDLDLSPADLPTEWHLLWEERAAIMESDAGLSRERADALALADTLDQMRRQGFLLNNDACK